MMRKIAPVSDEQIREAHRRYTAMENRHEIARDLDMTVTTLYLKFKRHGLPIRPHGMRLRKLSPAAVFEAHKSYMRREDTTETIGRRLGVTPTAVSRAFHRFGLFVFPSGIRPLRARKEHEHVVHAGQCIVCDQPMEDAQYA